MIKKISLLIPVAVPSNSWVCGRSLVGIAGSNLPGGMGVCCESCVLSGRCLWVGLITCPEESYRVCCVWMWSWGSPGPLGAVAPGGGREDFFILKSEFTLVTYHVTRLHSYEPVFLYSPHYKHNVRKTCFHICHPVISKPSAVKRNKTEFSSFFLCINLDCM
jgi:hypothetical protein